MMQERTEDVYEWIVTYTDDSTIRECDRSVGRGFAEVGEKPVKEIRLRPIMVGDFQLNLPEHRVSIPNGASPIFFRRRSLVIHIVDEQSHMMLSPHCIGWKRGDEAVYLFVFANGSTLLTDNLQAV